MRFLLLLLPVLARAIADTTTVREETYVDELEMEEADVDELEIEETDVDKLEMEETDVDELERVKRGFYT